MIKKLISLVCCLLPMGAVADALLPETGSESVSVSQFPTDGSAVIIGGGNGIDANTSDGLTVAGSMYVGAPDNMGGANGSLVVLDTASTPFTVVSGGNVSINSMLQVLNGWDFGIKTTGTGSDVKIGSVDNKGTFKTENINTFISGGINSVGNLTINTNDKIEIANLVASGQTKLSGGVNGIVSSGVIQNNAGQMTLVSGADINVGGDLNNSGDGLNVTGGALVVAGAMQNNSVSGDLVLNVDSLSVDGALVNRGSVNAIVAGNTYFADGIRVENMDAGNTFSLKTKTLDLGGNNSLVAGVLQFDIDVEDGGLTLGNVVNQAASGGLDTNMSVAVSGAFVANSVNNYGDKLSVNAADITIRQSLIGAAGSDTEILSAGTLATTGTGFSVNVSNAGDMTLGGNNILLASVVNGAGALTIKAPTDSTGNISIAGDLTNDAGTVTVSGGNVGVAGALVNDGGTMDITTGGNFQVKSVSSAGGAMTIDALAGGINVAGDLNVSGGAFNTGVNTSNVAVDGNVHIYGDFSASPDATSDAGGMNVAVKGVNGFTMVSDSILIDDAVNMVAADVVRNVVFDAPLINIADSVNIGAKAKLVLGQNATTYVNIDNLVDVDAGGTVETFANNMFVGGMDVDGLFVMHGPSVIATAEDLGIGISGNIYFDPENEDNNDGVFRPSSGMLVRGTNTLTLQTQKSGADITVGAVSVGNGKKLALDSGADVTIGGVLTNNGNTVLSATGVATVSGKLTNSATVDVSGASVALSDIYNTGALSVDAKSAGANLGAIQNYGVLTVQASSGMSATLIEHFAGKLDINAASVAAQVLTLNGDGTVANINSASVNVDTEINVAGDIVNGGTGGMLNTSATSIFANDLTAGGISVMSGNVTYDVETNVSVGGDIVVAQGAGVLFDVEQSMSAGDFTNAGNTTVLAGREIEFADFASNSGSVVLDSGAGLVYAYDFLVSDSKIVLSGAGVSVENDLTADVALYQGDEDAKFNVKPDNYEITAGKVDVAGINQNGKLLINSSDINIAGDIVASDLQFVAQKADNGQTIWQNIVIDGNVSGNVDFIGVEKMTINNGGNYVFSPDGMINAAILPNAPGAMNTTDINYWADIDFIDGGSLGQIINPTGDNARALVDIAGTFTAGAVYDDSSLTLGGGALSGGEIGITLHDTIDYGSAIWFLHADNGIQNASPLELVRNLDVRYCNADGSICYNYLDSLNSNNASGEDMPAYISVRDSNADGVLDDMYIVFDPRFDEPVLLNGLKLQTIVERTNDYTSGEYASAGALDNLIAAQLERMQFHNKTPIEVLPLIFQDTNLEAMAQELYLRMEEYTNSTNGVALTNFSRLFQAREMEQLVGGMVLNEHTSFRSFEDYMFNEFIWNRNRALKKAWVDVDYGMFLQNVDGGERTDGHRFSVAGGFDWQQSNTLVLGLTGRVSHISSDLVDSINLGYGKDTVIPGRVHSDVSDTNVALGGYFMKILDEEFRMYGNLFADIHLLEVERTQNFVDEITGDATAFSLISEWGLMHDILNQYIVGNLYARAGYNFGFDMTEKSGGADYMDMQADGYFMLTPGYSLTAQKRIYPSAWFQIRPYASVGVEYDLFGAPDDIKYKFAIADSWTKYGVDMNPLWANIGAGVEMLSANGLQFGLDYRYQYNDAMQLHNIKASLSYRF